MKLTDLHPEWMNAGGEGITRADGSPAPLRQGVGVLFDCPCGSEHCQQLYIPFANPLDGSVPKRGWQRTGETFDTLTLTPSILRLATTSVCCGWHGYVTNGEILTV